MFRFIKKPSSGSHRQYLAKITSLVQCRYRRRTDVVSAMAVYYAAIALEVHCLQPPFYSFYLIDKPERWEIKKIFVPDTEERKTAAS
jgi:hypothetical protein